MSKGKPRPGLEIINVDDSPKILDSKLKKNYGFGLYDFTNSLVDVFNSHISNKTISVPRKHYQDLRIRLRNLFVESIKTISSLDISIAYKLPFKYYKIPFKEQFKEVQTIFDTKEYVELLKRFQGNIDTQEDLYTKNKGRLIEPRNLLAVLWSKVMIRKNSRKVDWKNIVSLFEWFYLALKNTYMGPLLRPTSKDKLKYEDGAGFDEFQFQREVRRNGKLILRTARYTYYRDSYFKDYFSMTKPNTDSRDLHSLMYSKTHCIDLRIRKNIPEHEFMTDDDRTDFFIGPSEKKIPPQIIFPDGKVLR